ncbi:MAG: hypothetical protein QOH11_1769 [Solirubrobacteraceae bacterium]|nr:hypothetical protein [Solirubrobacteraceae bacterium]
MTDSGPNVVLLVAAGLACVLLIVGAVGTWQEADVSSLGLNIHASATGVEHGSDGPIVIGMAVVAGIMVLCYLLVPGRPLWAAIVALVIAGLALLTVVADTIDVGSRTYLSPGWGLYLDIFAAIALTAACALLVREAVAHGRAVRATRPIAPWPAQQPVAPMQPTQTVQPAQPLQPAQPAAPAGWHADPWRQKRLRYWDGTQWTGHTAD